MTWDNPVARQISILRSLDKVDQTILALRHQRDAVRNQVGALKEEIASFHTGLTDIDREMAACRTQQRNAEHELDRVERKLKKLSQGLATISAKEYEASRKEQAHLAARKDELEEEILACMETTEDLVARKKALRKHIEERKASIAAEYDALKAEYEALGRQVAEQKRDRDLILPQLAPEFRYTYQRLMQRYDRSVVSVVEDRCTGCKLHVPPQHVVDVLTGQGLHTCQHCGRFVLPEDETGDDEETDG